MTLLRPGQWPMGRADVEELLDNGHVRTCPPDESGARRLILKGRQHLESARDLANKENPDTETAADALHSANRKACEAVLLVQGLESTKLGGHIAVIRVVREQTRISGKPRPEFAVYDVVRQLRHEGDYGNQLFDLPAADILDNLDDCAILIDQCEKLLATMPVFVDTRPTRR